MSLAFIAFARRYPGDMSLVACINLALVCAVLDVTVAASLL